TAQARLGPWSHNLEPQRPGEWRGLDKEDADRAAKPERLFGSRPHERAVGLLEAEIIVAQSPRRDEPVSPGFVQFHEQADARNACDAASEDSAHAIREMRRDHAADGF